MARILVIDDEEMIRDMLRRTLELAGHIVGLAEDGDAGLAAQKAAAFDLVITDLIMPGKEGLETIMELRHSSPKTKIIAISGGGRGKAAGYLQLAAKLGARRTLAKPFTLPALAKVIDEVLHEN